MSWFAIAGAPVQWIKTNGQTASGHYIQFEAAGTSTSINMATDNTGGTELVRALLDDAGYPASSGAIFVPHIDRNYKISLYPTLADAIAKTNEVWNPDNLGAFDTATTLNHDDVAAMTADGTIAVGQVVQTKEFASGLDDPGGAIYDTVLTSGVTPNGYDVIIGVADATISFVLRYWSKDIEARTLAELTAGNGGFGANPNDEGIQWVGADSAGNQTVYGAIQVEMRNTTAGAQDGRMHFLVNDTDFSQPVGTVTFDGSWVFGPGIAAYTAEICGEQTINAVVGDGAIFGERLCVVENDNSDSRAFAVRNAVTADLTDITYRARIGFSILNTDGKERATGYVGARYSVRTANVEDSHMYFTTLVAGAQIESPQFHGKDITGAESITCDDISADQVIFPSTAVPSGDPNTLDDYEEGTFTAGLTAGTSGTITTATFKTLSYTKIGRRVYIQGAIAASAVSSPVGSLRLTGLPFTSATGLTEHSDLSAGGLYYNLLTGAITGALRIDILDGVTEARITDFDPAAGSQLDDVANHCAVNTIFTVGFSYLTN